MEKFVIYIALAIIASVLAVQAQEEPTEPIPTAPEPVCVNNYEPLGCFKENKTHRAHNELLFTDRDPTSPVYSGRFLTWPDYKENLPEFICRCSEAAKAKKYRQFSLQYWGECWGTGDSKIDIWKHGRSRDCMNGQYKRWSNNMEGCKNDRHNVGKSWTSFVYRVKQWSCLKRKFYKPLGCFENVKGWKKRFNTTITATIKNEKNKQGKLCKCSKRARKEGWEVFFVTKSGSCYVSMKDQFFQGKDDLEGVTQKACSKSKQTKCNCNNGECVGKAYEVIRKKKANKGGKKAAGATKGGKKGDKKTGANKGDKKAGATKGGKKGGKKTGVNKGGKKGGEKTGANKGGKKGDKKTGANKGGKKGGKKTGANKGGKKGGKKTGANKGGKKGDKKAGVTKVGKKGGKKGGKKEGKKGGENDKRGEDDDDEDDEDDEDTE